MVDVKRPIVGASRLMDRKPTRQIPRRQSGATLDLTHRSGLFMLQASTLHQPKLWALVAEDAPEVPPAVRGEEMERERERGWVAKNQMRHMQLSIQLLVVQFDASAVSAMVQYPCQSSRERERRTRITITGPTWNTSHPMRLLSPEDRGRRTHDHSPVCRNPTRT